MNWNLLCVLSSHERLCWRILKFKSSTIQFNSRLVTETFGASVDAVIIYITFFPSSHRGNCLLILILFSLEDFFFFHFRTTKSG